MARRKCPRCNYALVFAWPGAYADVRLASVALNLSSNQPCLRSTKTDGVGSTTETW
jgi:hypothetical protein